MWLIVDDRWSMGIGGVRLRPSLQAAPSPPTAARRACLSLLSNQPPLFLSLSLSLSLSLQTQDQGIYTLVFPTPLELSTFRAKYNNYLKENTPRDEELLELTEDMDVGA